MAELKLKNILDNIEHQDLTENQLQICVGQLILDSRHLASGDTFIAVPGYQTDGRKFIGDAFSKQVALVIAESNDNKEFLQAIDNQSEENKEKTIWIENLREQLSLLAANYFDHPSHNLKVIGVTGTNGKTSCSYMIAKALQKLNFECYLLGTLGLGQSGNLQVSDNTTADAITIQKILAEALEFGIQFASMEISSHGIAQKRIAEVKFHTAVFTNLTHDHLDFHGNMENYAQTKRELFLDKTLKNAVINMDDRFGRKLYKDESITATKWLVTTQLPTSGSNLNRWIWAEDVSFSLQGMHAKIYSPWGSGKMDSSLIGEFNLSNLLVVIATLGCILKDIKPVLAIVKKLDSAIGRMQKIDMDNAPLVVVDYAHTPDALEKALQSLRQHCMGLIWCVFGCGGDRDVEKRALMARIAEKYANRIVVTSDNPRTESPEAIFADILKGFKKPEKIKYIESREEAIEEVISQANVGDAILIAGKGHEDYQIIGTEKINLSDIQISTDAVKRRAYG